MFWEILGQVDVSTAWDGIQKEKAHSISNMGSAPSTADDINALEIHHWYRKFMKECPSGQLSLHEFKGLLDLHGMNPEATKYIEQVFSTFDMNKVCCFLRNS